jgi:PAS domain S-box-containing protein
MSEPRRGDDAEAATRLSAVPPSVFLGSERDASDILRAVVTMSPLPMVLTDPSQPDDPVVFLNQAFTALTGYSEDDVLGTNCRFLQGPETDPASIQILAKAVQDNTRTQVELWNYRKDGSAFWNSMFVGPVYDRDGKLLYRFGSQVDATSRREVDEARARAQRMDTLGSMAAGIAHEFNNLMTVVAGNVEGVAAETLTARQAERLGRIEWAARAAGRLTQQMLSFAGRQGLHDGVVDLNQVVGNFDRLLTQIASSKAKVEVRLHHEPLFARIDAGELELALINLVRNASDASPSGGLIIVQTCLIDHEGKPIVEVAVSDSGTGMSPEIAARATEAFFTTKGHGKGTGLGLSMVMGFCQAAGGTMLFETVEGEGTTIRMRLPVCQAGAEDAV